MIIKFFGLYPFWEIGEINEEIKKLEQDYRIVETKVFQEKIKNEFGDKEVVQQILTFIEKSNRGIIRK